MFNKIKTFLLEVRQEMTKVSWPTFMELKGSTVVVIIVSILLSAFIFVIDRILSFLMQRFLQ